MNPARQKNVVLLVDNRHRDLLVSALIAHQLDALGVKCHLEPLEAYQGALGAYRPDMIVFNHLLASHLVNYSRRLHDMGVLTAVLPNEGIAYNEGDLRFLAGNHHSTAHIDFFFSWNELHRRALLDAGFDQSTRIETIGVPRFDLYFPPWNKLFLGRPRLQPRRPLLLLCTNFVFAHYRQLAPESVDKFFAPWKDRIPDYHNYWGLVDIHARSQQKFFAFLDALVRADEFEIILRPHPSEDLRRYQTWFDNLSLQVRTAVSIDPKSSIAELILACDLEFSCETCTTALESWIARKPTIELSFERHALFAKSDAHLLNVICTDADKVVETVRAQLAQPEQIPWKAARAAHLAKWCSTPAGDSSLNLAHLIATAVKANPQPDWSKLTTVDHRRSLKLKLLRKLGLAYHYDPWLSFKGRLFPKKYGIKSFTYRKSIRPSDVAAMRTRIQASQQESLPTKSARPSPTASPS